MPFAMAEAASAKEALREKVMRKAVKHIVPLLILMYIVAFLDRSNVGLAKEALRDDVGITDAIYAFGAGIFFLGYALFELPSNLIMYRLGARRWMTRIMVSWGLVSAAMMFVTGEHSFIILRSLLGVAEAGFFPGIMLYLTYWFPEKERARVLGLFYFGYPLAMTFGSPLSGSLFELDGFGGLRGWQWMFLLEGALAVGLGVFTLFYLPDRPKHVKWLNDDEKALLQGVLDAESRVRAERKALREKKKALLFSPKLLHFLLLYGLIQIASYGVVFYLPDQVSSIMGEKMGFYVGLISALPWVCSVCATWALPRLAQRYRRPRLGMIICFLAASVGLIVSGLHIGAYALLGLCLAASGVVAVQAIFWNFPLSHYEGIEAAAATALINAIGNLGGFLAPNLRAAADDHWHTPLAGLCTIAAAGLIGAMMTLALRRQKTTTSHAIANISPSPKQDVYDDAQIERV